jgi:hypothetical protein
VNQIYKEISIWTTFSTVFGKFGAQKRPKVQKKKTLVYLDRSQLSFLTAEFFKKFSIGLVKHVLGRRCVVKAT